MKGLIFDMDGTMVDNMMVHHRAWQETFADVGINMSLEEVMEKAHGINTEILERLFNDQFTVEKRVQISNRKEENYRRIFFDRLQLLPGLQNLIEEAFALGVPMTIASAAPIENVDYVLDNLSLRHYFQNIFHAGSVTKGKPDPEVYLMAAESMGLACADCIVFEDSVTGAEASSRAGAKSVIVTTTHQPSEFQAFENILHFIKDFAEISLDDLINRS